MIEIRRLHIGAKNLIEIPKVSWSFLSQESWVHLGTQKINPSHYSKNKNKNDRENKTLSRFKKVYKFLKNDTEMKEVFPEGGDINHDDLLIWEKSKMIPWYYKKMDFLPFVDEIFTFVYSEHFFEHLFLDEAICLFQEIYRVMAKRGIVRTVVPDADLRNYELPEPVGYPDVNMAWNDPEKHKTRWSFNVLGGILKIVGFESIIGLAYCTPKGEFINKTPEECRSDYMKAIDTDAIFNMHYIARPRSLIVDAIK
ncbi:MAG: methyltransferase domain-containing protein [Thermodesulfobacteriota bacterium]|nr:methyltransferase domain-containing protein [Thermodesulfobacteriota bacterium]